MSDTFAASGVITVTTDFGHRGPFVGTMKGVILNRFADARIVDLTHEAYVHWPAEAGFWLARSYHYFPCGSVHMAVVDPGVGTDRSIVLACGDNHVFLAPDNGLLAEVVERTAGEMRRVAHEVIEQFRLSDTSATFHGRDVFSPLAAALASGQLSVEDCGEITIDYVPSIVEPPEQRGAQIVGVVMTTDHFGNLITNIEQSQIEQFRQAVAHVGGHEIPVRRTYGDVDPGDLLALVNSFGVIEIARAEQDAAAFLGVSRGAPIKITEADV